MSNVRDSAAGDGRHTDTGTQASGAAVPFPNALKARPTLRQSLLAQFDNCALTTHFELEYRRGWDSHPAGRGHLLHACVARCLEEMARHGSESIEVDVALAILHETLRQEHVDDVCHQSGCELPARALPQSERGDDGRPLICAAGHRHHSAVVNVPMREIKDLYWVVKKWAFDNVWEISHLVDTERRLETTIEYPNPYGGVVPRRLTGQLDALFIDRDDSNHAIVLDWKDTWAMPAASEISDSGYFQQRFYALLVMRAFRHVERVTLREFYVRYSESREAQITRDQLPDIEAEMSSLAERFDRAYETDIWKPTPGKHCNFCSRPAACPIPVFAKQEGRITDPEHARKLAAQLMVAEVVVKQTKQALKSFVDVHGPVPVKDAKGETEWGYLEREYEKKPSLDQVREAEARGESVASLYGKAKGTTFRRYTVKPGKKAEDDEALFEMFSAALEEAKRR